MSERVTIRLANDQQHTSIVGANGSGKTFAAAWNLARRDFDRKPWIIYDFKRDELLNSIHGARHIDVSEPIPTEPGIYLVHPRPYVDAEAVEAQLVQIWENENTGLYIDEGYMVDRMSPALSAIMTQGRSKRCPVIILTQRPVWLNPYILSEAQFIQIFRLSSLGDKKRMSDCIDGFNLEKRPRLPEYHSYYYDVTRDSLAVLPPTPDADAILDTFDTRLKRMNKNV